MRATKTIPATDPSCVSEAVRVLRGGGLVCYPTDTVYGVGATAGNDGAVRRLFAVKERAPDKALPLLLAEAWEAAAVAQVTPLAEALMERFWPGGVTIVMRRASSYRSLALGGGDTVALRVPDSDIVRAIVRELGQPLTGTSANRAEEASPASADAVASQLGESVDLIIDGGRCDRGVESTVVDITRDRVKIVRAGAVSREEIEVAAGGRVR